MARGHPLLDTDDDGLADGTEVNVHQTNPKDGDSDNDGRAFGSLAGRQGEERGGVGRRSRSAPPVAFAPTDCDRHQHSLLSGFELYTRDRGAYFFLSSCLLSGPLSSSFLEFRAIITQSQSKMD